MSFPSGESVEVPELPRRSRKADVAAKTRARRDRVAKYLVAMLAVLEGSAVGCFAIVLEMLQSLQSVVHEIRKRMVPGRSSSHILPLRALWHMKRGHVRMLARLKPRSVDDKAKRKVVGSA